MATYRTLPALLLYVTLAGCSQLSAVPANEAVSSISQDVSAANRVYPQVVSATARLEAGTYVFSVSIAQPNGAADRIGGFRTMARDGRVLDEYSSTEGQGAGAAMQFEHRMAVPAGIEVVLLQARDVIDGYGGPVYELRLSAR